SSSLPCWCCPWLRACGRTSCPVTSGTRRRAPARIGCRSASRVTPTPSCTETTCRWFPDPVARVRRAQRASCGASRPSAAQLVDWLLGERFDAGDVPDPLDPVLAGPRVLPRMLRVALVVPGAEDE